MQRRTFLVAAGAAGLALLVSPAIVRAGQKGTPPKVPQVQFEDYKLKNGLRVLLSPDKSAPVVAVSVTYNVGSRNERPGRSGFAHLFEHMMFQGSENVGKGEHMQLVGNVGGSMNGTTNADRTNYFETVPANQLDLALYLEADRMRSLDISPANLDNQRAVVQEEKRQSYENQPYGKVYETLLGLAYQGFPYQHTTIGSMEDLNAATLDDIRQFFKTYYAPNNAALAVVGDFDVAEARQKIEKYFGGVPRQPEPPRVAIREPLGTAEKRTTLQDAFARLPRYQAAYRTVPGDNPDFFALALLGDILADGRTARLYAPLVEKQLALGVNGGQPAGRGPGLFQISASLPPGGKIEPVEAAIEAEIARVQQNGVTAEELAKAKTQERAGAVGRLATALGKANALSQYAIYYDNPNRINTEIERIQAVTAADVRRVARKYLTKNNRVVVITQPTAAGAPTAATGAPAATSRRQETTNP